MTSLRLPLHCLFFFGIYLVSVSSSTSVKSTVHIEEERPPDSFVVNVAELFKADKYKLSRRKFKFNILNQKLKTQGIQPQKGINDTWVKLDSETGVLTTSRKIDRDAECAGITHCVVVVQVYMLPHSDFLLLDLEMVIDDINDNAPDFQRDVINVRITEAFEVGEKYSLDSFQAKDADSGNNSSIFYELSANSHFSLRQRYGRGGLQHLEIVLNEKLDYEEESTINLILAAMDLGSPTRRSEIGLEVTVLDANDNSPLFDQEEYRVTLLENSSPGLVVDTVTARDEDSGAFGEVRYSVSERNTELARELFTIDPRSGELRLREKVDREKHNGARILIEARDSDLTNQKMGQAWLIVNVEDLNDNVPQIGVLFISLAIENTVYIPESAQKETFIMRISATDADSGDNGRVRLTMETSLPCEKISDGDVTAQGTFVLHPEGLVATVQPLDRESCDEYIIMISACDHGNPSKCSSKAIKVKVLDENEFAPKFRASTQHVTVPENIPIDTRVTTVTANDGDSVGENALAVNPGNEIVASKNGVVEYYLTQGSRGPFSLNRKTGEIRLHRKLDREDKDEWKITVTARDGALPRSLESSCTIIITVSDVNDNAPRFLNPRKNNSMFQASTVSDEPVIKLMASDKDSGKNGEVHYKLLSEEQESFNTTRKVLHVSANASYSSFVLNPTTGVLKLNFSRSNFSGILGLHTVKVQAYDMGEPSLNTNVTLRIRVTNSPIVHNLSGDITSAAKFPLIVGTCVGSALFIVLIVMAIVVAVRCRKANRESKSYSLPKDDVNVDVITKEANLEVRSLEAEPVDATVENEFQDKSRITVASKLFDDVAASTSRCDSLSRHSHEDMGYLSVARNADFASPSHSDGDSGRGDSESDGLTCRNQRNGELRALGNSSKLGATCTEQCVELGHSDSCWMPLIKNPGCKPPTNRPLCRLSKSASPQDTSGIRNNRHPLRGMMSCDPHEYRSPSRASTLDENLEYNSRTPSNSNVVGYDTNLYPPSRCISPSYGHLQNPQGLSSPSAVSSHAMQNRLTSSYFLMPRDSVASNSNLLAEDEKYHPSSSATNFLINYHHGNTKINAQKAQKSLNPHCRPSTSTTHMSAINVPRSVPSASQHFVGGPAPSYAFSSPTDTNGQDSSGQVAVASTSMLV